MLVKKRLNIPSNGASVHLKGRGYHRNHFKGMKCGLEILEEFRDDYGFQGRR